MADTALTPEQTEALRAWIDEGTRLRALHHEAKQTERVEALRDLATQYAAAKARVEEHTAAQADRATAARTAEQRADDLRARVDRTETKLNDGTGLTSRDLLSLQDEIAGLKDTIDTVELEQMEAMEAAEAAQTEADTTRADADALAARGRTLQQERAQEGERLAAEVAAVEQKRAALLESVPAALHGRLRAEGAYPAAAVVTTGSCGACGAQLSGVAADAHRNLGAGGLLDCDDCGALLLALS